MRDFLLFFVTRNCGVLDKGLSGRKRFQANENVDLLLLFCSYFKSMMTSCFLSRDLKCGKLYCTGGSRMPSTGSLVAFDSCKGSFPSKGEKDNGMVAPGTKCGEGMVSKAPSVTPSGSSSLVVRRLLLEMPPL